MHNDTKVGWGPCCFCSSPIPETDIDPCRLTVETTAGLWQVWFCHSSCFKERLANDPIGMFTPAHF
jgi:hypothetical protein